MSLAEVQLVLKQHHQQQAAHYLTLSHIQTIATAATLSKEGHTQLKKLQQTLQEQIKPPSSSKLACTPTQTLIRNLEQAGVHNHG